MTSEESQSWFTLEILLYKIKSTLFRTWRIHGSNFWPSDWSVSQFPALLLVGNFFALGYALFRTWRIQFLALWLVDCWAFPGLWLDGTKFATHLLRCGLVAWPNLKTTFAKTGSGPYPDILASDWMAQNLRHTLATVWFGGQMKTLNQRILGTTWENPAQWQDSVKHL